MGALKQRGEISMSALPFLVMLAALFVFVFNFQTVLTQSRRAVAYFTSSNQASRGQAGPDTKGGCAQTWSCAVLLTRARGAGVRRRSYLIKTGMATNTQHK